MMTHRNTRLMAAGAIMLSAAATTYSVGCSPCPQPERLSPGTYTVENLIEGDAEPLQDWIIERTVGSTLTVFGDSRTAELVYTVDDTTFVVVYDVK